MYRHPSATVLFQRLVIVALLLTMAVVSLGAYVRLSDAGLSCPDWPGCYGKLVVPQTTERFPERPLERDKAWKEMVHRYAAGTLGLLLMVLWLLAQRAPGLKWARPLTTALLLLVLFQALLGMWTVTLLLKPVIVMAHLLGGFSIAMLLLWLAWLGRERHSVPRLGGGSTRLARLVLVTVIAQITLGGWVSANYAAPICPDFPTCQGQWWPEMTFANALWPESPGVGGDYEGGTLDAPARTAIHMSHRIGALFSTGMVGLLILQLLRQAQRGPALLLGAALSLQVGLGIATVMKQFPLWLALAHNGGGLLLLLVTFGIYLHLTRTASVAATADNTASPAFR